MLLDLLRITRPLAQVGLALALLPIFVAIVQRLRRRDPPAVAARLILAYPASVLVLQWNVVRVVLDAPDPVKVDLRIIRFMQATSDLLSMGPVLVLLIAAYCVVRTYREVALPGLAAAGVGCIAASRVRELMSVMAIVPPGEKQLAWTSVLVAHEAWAAGSLLVGLGMAAKARGWGRAMALAPALPVLFWPGWIPLRVLAE